MTPRMEKHRRDQEERDRDIIAAPIFFIIAGFVGYYAAAAVQMILNGPPVAPW